MNVQNPSAPPMQSSETRPSIRHLTDHCRAYKGADTQRSILQLATTAALFVLTISAMFAILHHGTYWLYALLLLPAAGLLIRLFIIQHDCGHGSFFSSGAANDTTGRLISLLSFTPYGLWRRAHNIHHASSGNLNRRGAGAIDTLTVREYQALSGRQRFFYRLYRNPFLLLIVGPPVYLLILQRFAPMQSLPFLKDYHPVPAGQAWRSVLALNFFLVVFYGSLMALLGWKMVLMVYLPVLFSAFWIGQWLFFVQHQFEDAYWARGESWNFPEAAFHGSSYYVLHPVLQWFTGNIGFHHIHHLCSAIPNYRLQECCEGNNTLMETGRITFAQSLKCIRFALWDEDLSKMIGFRDLQKIQPA